jgi:uncharacterized C2H2 Zn-finger protein
MPFTITGCVIYADCECPKCGHGFAYEAEGDEYVNEMFSIEEVQCPNCGHWFKAEEEEE